MISYKPLLKLLIDKNIKKLELREMVGISSSTLAKFNTNEYVSLEIIDKLCKSLNCSIGDLIEYIPDEE